MSNTTLGRNERAPDPEEVMRLAFEAGQSRLWTAMPGIVQSFNATEMTVVVRLAINGLMPTKNGGLVSTPIPDLLDVPVLWQGGGGATLTFPIVNGDECLVVFSARCIDAWWKFGEVRDPATLRMHNLSDGFALVGVRSLANAFAVDTSKVVLRSDDGLTSIAMDPAGKTLVMTAPNGINLNGVTIDSAGNIIANDIDTRSGVLVDLQTHTHSGGTLSGHTGPPDSA